MADHTGKAQACLTFMCPAQYEAEGDRLLALHADWMARTHPREGDEALLQYTVAKSHDAAGNAYFRLTEVYESQAGNDDHLELSDRYEEDWKADCERWARKCQVFDWAPDTEVVHSLW